MAKASTNICSVFYKFWYLPLIGTICSIALTFIIKVKTFSCYAFAIKIVQWQWICLDLHGPHHEVALVLSVVFHWDHLHHSFFIWWRCWINFVFHVFLTKKCFCLSSKHFTTFAPNKPRFIPSVSMDKYYCLTRCIPTRDVYNILRFLILTHHCYYFRHEWLFMDSCSHASYRID